MLPHCIRGDDQPAVLDVVGAAAPARKTLNEMAAEPRLVLGRRRCDPRHASSNKGPARPVGGHGRIRFCQTGLHLIHVLERSAGPRLGVLLQGRRKRVRDATGICAAPPRAANPSLWPGGYRTIGG